jgi:hypothetical protein
MLWKENVYSKTMERYSENYLVHRGRLLGPEMGVTKKSSTAKIAWEPKILLLTMNLILCDFSFVSPKKEFIVGVMVYQLPDVVGTQDTTTWSSICKDTLKLLTLLLFEDGGRIGLKENPTLAFTPAGIVNSCSSDKSANLSESVPPSNPLKPSERALAVLKTWVLSDFHWFEEVFRSQSGSFSVNLPT